MRRKIFYIGGILLALITGLSASGILEARRNPGASEAAKRRTAARHYYLTAAHYNAIGKNAEAAELFKKAYQLDTTYSEAALQYGIRRWGMPSDTLSTPVQRSESKRIAKKFPQQYPGDFFPNILFSNILDRSNLIEESKEILERLHEYDPGNTDVLERLSALYLDTEDFDNALKTINEYQRIEGDDIEVLIRKAGMLLAMGDTVGAIDETDRLIEKYPADTQYVIFKGQLYNYINLPDSALHTLQKAERMEKPGMGGPVKLQLADYYREHGDSVAYDAKIYEALLSEDLDFDAKNSVMGYYLQTLFRDNGDHARGDRLFTVLRQQYPHEPELLSLSGRYNAAKHDFEAALEDMDYCISLDHSQPEYWEQAIIYAVMADDNKRAAQLFERAKKALDRAPLNFYTLAGNNAAMMKDYDGALRIYQEGFDEYVPGQKTTLPVDMQQLGKYLTINNIMDVISLFQQTGDAYYQKGDKENAYMNYESALEIDPENALTLNNYAYFLIEDHDQISEEDLEKADRMSARAIATAPDNPVYLDTRAWFKFRKGEYQEALELEERAIELLPDGSKGEDVSEYYAHLGDILFMLNRPQDALEKWKKALEETPDDELLKKKVKHKTFFYE